MSEIINQRLLTGERALYASHGLEIHNCTFADGESPIKECSDISLFNSVFKWKYPIWYSKDIRLENCALFEMARAGIWYVDRISIRNTIIDAPKTIRRCRGVSLENVQFTKGEETLWHCNEVNLKNVTVHGDYFGMNSENITIDGFNLVGHYSLDGCRNLEIRNAKILSRDTFWNCENVTVYDSFISGEYLGWNTRNLTLVNCTIESLQGLCYIDNLVMKNCRLNNTTLAFEYSTVDADITGNIDSVINPSGGRITADSIGELILQRDHIDPEKTVIVCRS